MAGDDKWEDESLVVIELSGIIEQDWIQNIGDKCKIVGLDTDEPLLQIDRYVFSGQHKDTDGTDVIFEHSPGAAGDAGQVQLRYKCHTFKKLSMQRAFLTAKDGESSADATEVLMGESTAELTQPEVDCVGDEHRDDTAASCVATDVVQAGQNKTDTKEQSHAGGSMLELSGSAEEDIAPVRTCEENNIAEDS